PGAPLFVVRLEPSTRRVVVGPAASLGVTTFPLREVNWLGEAPGPKGVRVVAKVRSATPPASATAFAEADGARVVLDAPQRGVAPGQCCVFYDGTRVLGGGWIRRADARAAA